MVTRGSRSITMQAAIADIREKVHIYTRDVLHAFGQKMITAKPKATDFRQSHKFDNAEMKRIE